MNEKKKKEGGKNDARNTPNKPPRPLIRDGPTVLQDPTTPITNRETWRRTRRVRLELLTSKRHPRIAGIPGNQLAFESGDTNVDEAATVVRRGDAGDTAIVGGGDGGKRSAVADPTVDFIDGVTAIRRGDEVGGSTGGVGGCCGVEYRCRG